MREVRELFVAVTGASGVIYADRLLRKAVGLVPRVDLVLSTHGAEIAAHEVGWGMDFDTVQLTGPPDEVLSPAPLSPQTILPRYASGSAAPDAMIIVPASLNVIGRVAVGIGDALITRGPWQLARRNEGRSSLVARESPLSLIDLRNLVTLAEAGATIMPAAPAFYSNPKTIDELADYFVVRLLDQIGVRVEHAGRWGG